MKAYWANAVKKEQSEKQTQEVKIKWNECEKWEKQRKSLHKKANKKVLCVPMKKREIDFHSERGIAQTMLKINAQYGN